jgi:BolA protein
MMKAKIEKILTETFHPEFLQVLDDSHKHAGHNPHAKKGGTHFSIEIVSKRFIGKSLVDRHRMIYEALKVPLDEGVHALAISAKVQK